jgi:hypothetical protein
MGNASYRQTTATAPTQDMRNYFQTDLPKFILQSKIGDGKFMKTYVMRVDSTPLVLKVRASRYPPLTAHCSLLATRYSLLTPHST